MRVLRPVQTEQRRYIAAENLRLLFLAGQGKPLALGIFGCGVVGPMG